jgi:hypothetical protein
MMPVVPAVVIIQITFQTIAITFTTRGKVNEKGAYMMGRMLFCVGGEIWQVTGDAGAADSGNSLNLFPHDFRLIIHFVRQRVEQASNPQEHGGLCGCM